MDNERDENFIFLQNFSRRVRRIERGQANSHSQKQRELTHDNKATGDQSFGRISVTASAQVSLHHHLVSTVRSQCQQSAADSSCPDGVLLRKIECKIEHSKFLFGRSELSELSPSAGQSANHQNQCGHATADVDDKLKAVAPDDGFHAAYKCVGHRAGPDHDDACVKAEARHFFHDDRRKEKSQTVAKISCDQKNQRSCFLSQSAEPLVQHFISCE